jgi:hypothetical protein
MKRIIGIVAALVLLFPIALGLYLSFRYLPSIHEMPPRLGESSREGQNWIGQGGGAFAGYTALLLVAAYSFKRILLTSCKRRWIAVYYFAMFFLLALPYAWFLCEPDWFNPFVFRKLCWIGGPVAIWFVPAVSFVVDLCLWDRAQPLNIYLLRSGVEIVLLIPLWTLFCAFFSFFVLGWGWI